MIKEKTKFKETETGPIPEGWNVFSIETVSDVIGGGTPSTLDNNNFAGDIPWITPRDLSNYDYRFISHGERYISKKGLDSSSAKLLPVNTVLLTTRAPVGYLAIAKNEVTTNQGFHSLIPNNKTNSLFLFYLLKNNVQKLIDNSSGSTFQELNGKTLKSLEFVFPENEEQKQIAEILSSLDDKIELNRKINENLEKLASSLFKQWFIDFEFPNTDGKPYKSSGGKMTDSELGEIPDGWEVVNLSFIAKLTMGVSPKSESYNDIGLGIPLLNGASDFKGKKIIPKKYTSQLTKICNIGDLVLCIRATIGNLTFADKKYCLGRGVASLTPSKEIFREYIYIIINRSLEELISKATGSVIFGLSKPDIENLKILLPSETILNKYHNLAKELLDYEIKNDEEILSLEEIRDSILPKLMNGKIRVNI